MHSETLLRVICHSHLLQAHSSSASCHGMILALLTIAKRCCCTSQSSAWHLLCSCCHSANQHTSLVPCNSVLSINPGLQMVAIITCQLNAAEHGLHKDCTRDLCILEVACRALTVMMPNNIDFFLFSQTLTSPVTSGDGTAATNAVLQMLMQLMLLPTVS